MSDFTDAVQTQVAETQAWKKRALAAEAEAGMGLQSEADAERERLVVSLMARAETAETNVDRWMSRAHSWKQRAEDAEAERDRLARALRHYADEDTWRNVAPRAAAGYMVWEYAGAVDLPWTVARAALAGTEQP